MGTARKSPPLAAKETHAPLGKKNLWDTAANERRGAGRV